MTPSTTTTRKDSAYIAQESHRPSLPGIVPGQTKLCRPNQPARRARLSEPRKATRARPHASMRARRQAFRSWSAWTQLTPSRSWRIRSPGSIGSWQ